MKKILIVVSLLVSFSVAIEPDSYLSSMLYEEVLTLADPDGTIIDSYGTRVLEYVNKDSTLKILVVSEPKNENYEIESIFVSEVTYLGRKRDLSISRSPNGTVKSEYIEYDEFSNLVGRGNWKITYSDMVSMYGSINWHVDYGDKKIEKHRSKRKKDLTKKMYI